MAKIFELKVNGKVIEMNNPQTMLVLEALLTVKDMTSKTTVFAVNQVDAKRKQAYKEFYPAILAEGKNLDDTFQVTVIKGEKVLKGTATRKQVLNRLMIASNHEEYETQLESTGGDKGDKTEKVEKIIPDVDSV